MSVCCCAIISPTLTWTCEDAAATSRVSAEKKPRAPPPPLAPSHAPLPRKALPRGAALGVGTAGRRYLDILRHAALGAGFLADIHGGVVKLGLDALFVAHIHDTAISPTKGQIIPAASQQATVSRRAEAAYLL